ncbi:hypothetical protein BK715_28550 [Bacillus thuringiensis serovar japonensis]|uniref:hypothetical protein n=1 Tax=Bacillus cereus TaxID=1396 RepID=UPI0009ABF058|nr:hypothetical protein [Bacillus cereus]OTW88568.1 hypothetical protein BK713_01970 [Bacillus thuringiensis serovar jinghongiensis]OTX10891.1 hypothetical protein BK715_28550 [Bacillus thuringiensis serovar japonensis]PEY49057.1 hypothetical protein CN348_20705 [Bacillus cereus]PFE34220.1 hypothetical protein CN294_28225 [Bacillus cereus]PFI78646.1 hypothetical protein COI85_00060 [Bacillus cereus]
MVFAMDVRFRHSFHEIESLDIPNVLFPSQCRKLYQVIGIGIQEEFRNPYVIIKEQHGSVTFRLPEELSTWVQNKLLLVKRGPVCFHTAFQLAMRSFVPFFDLGYKKNSLSG